MVDELRHRGVQTQAAAIDQISAWEGAGLTSGQIAEVLWQFAAPDPLAPQWDPDYDPQRCPEWEPQG